MTIESIPDSDILTMKNGRKDMLKHIAKKRERDKKESNEN
jgi:hypothetical protein